MGFTRSHIIWPLALVALLAAGCWLPWIKRSAYAVPDSVSQYEVDAIPVVQEALAGELVVFHLSLLREGECNADVSASDLLLMEALVHGATQDYSATEMADRMEQQGARVDYFLEPDALVIRLVCLPETAPQAWKQTSELLNWALLDDADIEAARQRLLSQVPAPDARLEARALAEAGAQVPACRLPGREALEQVQASHVRDRYGLLVARRCGMHITVTGPLTPAEVQQVLSGTLKFVPEGECGRVTRRELSPQVKSLKVAASGAPLMELSAVLPAPAVQHRDAGAYALALECLKARLEDRLLDEQRLAADISVDFVQSSVPHGLVRLSSTRGQQCGEWVVSELRQAAEKGFSDSLYRVAAQRFRVQAALENESLRGRAMRLDRSARWKAWERLPWEDQSGWIPALREVNAAAAAYFQGISWGLVGDTTKLDRTSLLRL